MVSPPNKHERQPPLERLPILPPGSMGTQMGLFPRRTVSELRPTGGSLDCIAEAEVDDGCFYYLKTDKNGRFIRASEWLSTHLAEDVGIAAPSRSIVQMRDGRIVFGSRRIAGVADQTVTVRYLLSPTVNGGEISGLSRLLSSIYVFDLFINNDDRHLGNYLTVDDGSVRRLFAFDYSRGFFWDWPWNGFPGPGSNTRDKGRLLRICHGFDANAAEEMLVKLACISQERIMSHVASMPSDWLDVSTRQGLIAMWAGAERLQRIETIRQGVASGWLL